MKLYKQIAASQITQQFRLDLEQHGFTLIYTSRGISIYKEN